MTPDDLLQRGIERAGHRSALANAIGVSWRSLSSPLSASTAARLETWLAGRDVGERRRPGRPPSPLRPMDGYISIRIPLTGREVARLRRAARGSKLLTVVSDAVDRYVEGPLGEVWPPDRPVQYISVRILTPTLAALDARLQAEGRLGERRWYLREAVVRWCSGARG